MVLRVAGPENLYEEARAAGMQVWEQLQAYSIRNPDFRTSKRPIEVPDSAPDIVRQMARLSAPAGVGPMFAFRGAITEFVGRVVARSLNEVVVSCGGDYFVVPHRRSRLPVRAGTAGGPPLAIVIQPELGPQGVFTTREGRRDTAEGDGDVVIVASSCILADAAAAGASAILSHPGSFGRALSYLSGVNGVHGAVLVQAERIGIAGSLELAE